MQPDDLDDVMRKLPLRVGVYLPCDLLDAWFGPDTGESDPSERTLQAAAEYGRRFECEFRYFQERKEGVFWKFVPAM